MAKTKKSNYRAVHKVLDRVKLKARYIKGSSEIFVPANTTRNGIEYVERVATDIPVQDNTLDNLRADPAVLEIGTVKEVRYKNLDDLKGAL